MSIFFSISGIARHMLLGFLSVILMGLMAHHALAAPDASAHSPTQRFIEILSGGDPGQLDISDITRDEETNIVRLRDSVGRYRLTLPAPEEKEEEAEDQKEDADTSRTRDVMWQADEIILKNPTLNPDSGTLSIERFSAKNLMIEFAGTETASIERITIENLSIPKGVVKGPGSFADRLMLCLTPENHICYALMTIDRVTLDLSALPAARDILIRQISTSIRNFQDRTSAAAQSENLPLRVRSRIDGLEVNWDTLTAQARDVFSSLGYNRLVASMLCSETWAPKTGAYELDYCRFSSPDMVKLVFKGKFNGLSLDFIKALSNFDQDPQIVAVLAAGLEVKSMQVDLTDYSLLSRALAIRAKNMNIPLETFKAQMRERINLFLESFFKNAPFVEEANTAITTFLEKPDTTLLLEVTPPRPVSFVQIGTAASLNATLLPKLLNLSLKAVAASPEEGGREQE